MKKYIYGIAIYNNGETKLSRNFTNYSAFSDWANKQFLKDEVVTVEEFILDTANWTHQKVSSRHK